MNKKYEIENNMMQEPISNEVTLSIDMGHNKSSLPQPSNPCTEGQTTKFNREFKIEISTQGRLISQTPAARLLSTQNKRMVIDYDNKTQRRASKNKVSSIDIYENFIMINTDL